MKMSRLEKAVVNRRVREDQAAADLLRHLEAIQPAPRQLILDVGCGTGAALRSAVLRYGVHGVGVDVDPDQVSLARRATPAGAPVQYRIADATTLPLVDDAFDIVVCRYTLHHVRRWRHAIVELHRTLKPGGWMWLADLVTPRWGGGLADAMAVPRPATAREIATAASDLGLSARRLDVGVIRIDGVWQKAPRGSGPSRAASAGECAGLGAVRRPPQ